MEEIKANKGYPKLWLPLMLGIGWAIPVAKEKGYDGLSPSLKATTGYPRREKKDKKCGVEQR